MSIEKMQAEFEAAVRKDFEEAGICEADLRKDESGQYLVDVHVAAWWAWQQAFPLAAVKVLEVWEREGVASLRADNTDLHATLQAAKGEIERLRSANKTVECRFEVSEDTLKTIRGCLASAEGYIDRLKAENETLRKDAERYRWLRDSSQYDWDVSYEKLELRIVTPHDDSSDLGACLDAAMSKEASQ